MASMIVDQRRRRRLPHLDSGSLRRDVVWCCVPDAFATQHEGEPPTPHRALPIRKPALEPRSCTRSGACMLRCASRPARRGEGPALRTAHRHAGRARDGRDGARDDEDAVYDAICPTLHRPSSHGHGQLFILPRLRVSCTSPSLQCGTRAATDAISQRSTSLPPFRTSSRPSTPLSRVFAAWRADYLSSLLVRPGYGHHLAPDDARDRYQVPHVMRCSARSPFSYSVRVSCSPIAHAKHRAAGVSGYELVHGSSARYGPWVRIHCLG